MSARARMHVHGAVCVHACIWKWWFARICACMCCVHVPAYLHMACGLAVYVTTI